MGGWIRFFEGCSNITTIRLNDFGQSAYWSIGIHRSITLICILEASCNQELQSLKHRWYHKLKSKDYGENKQTISD
jgi:hypothetical protein